MNEPTSDSNDIKAVIYSRDEHQISRQNIDPDAVKIMYRLLRHGYKAYLVGGGVRDLLLNKKPKDFDIATDATPRKIKELFRNSRIIGRRFKLVHIFFKDAKIIEVSTFRDVSDQLEPAESEEDSPDRENLLQTRDNKYGTEVTDAMRRDITINGLFYDLATFSIIDYVGGMEDLRASIVRVIGKPDIRFAEDPVRLLRVVRHAVRAGFMIEEECWHSILRCGDLLKQSSQVRVYEELKKDLASGHALPILQLLEKTRLLNQLLPDLVDDGSLVLPDHLLCRSLARADHEALQGDGGSPTAILSLLAFFMGHPEHSIDDLADLYRDSEALSEQINRSFKYLQVPRKEKERINEVIFNFSRILTDGLERIKIHSLQRMEQFPDLMRMVHYTNLDGQHDELIAQLENIQHNRREHRHERGHGHRGSRRSRRGGAALKRFI